MADEMSKNNKHSASTPNTTHMCIKQQSQHRFGWWLSLSFNIFSYACFTHIIYLFTADDVKLNEEKKKTQHSRWSSLRHLMPGGSGRALKCANEFRMVFCLHVWAWWENICQTDCDLDGYHESQPICGNMNNTRLQMIAAAHRNITIVVHFFS